VSPRGVRPTRGNASPRFWFVVEAKRMAKAGSTAQEIIERLNDWRHVLKDWRDDSPNHPLNLPGNDMPEYWPSGTLEKFIATRKPEWLKGPDQGDNPQVSEEDHGRSFGQHGLARSLYRNMWHCRGAWEI